MAEKGGFEPPVRFYPYNGLANRRFRPLSHLSAERYSSTSPEDHKAEFAGGMAAGLVLFSDTGLFH